MDRHGLKSCYEEQTDVHGMKLNFRNASVSAQISDSRTFRSEAGVKACISDFVFFILEKEDQHKAGLEG